MAEPTRLSVSVITESHRKKTEISRLFTLELLISWIRRLQQEAELDDYTTNGLIALASKYPAAALPSFRKNINLMIQRVRSQRQKDQEGENYAKEKPKKRTATKIHNPAESSDQIFNTGPQKVSITEEDLRDEWEDEVKEHVIPEVLGDVPRKFYQNIETQDPNEDETG